LEAFGWCLQGEAGFEGYGESLARVEAFCGGDAVGLVRARFLLSVGCVPVGFAVIWFAFVVDGVPGACADGSACLGLGENQLVVLVEPGEGFFCVEFIEMVEGGVSVAGCVAGGLFDLEAGRDGSAMEKLCVSPPFLPVLPDSGPFKRPAERL
jgi:hypothetical protein